jgi:hypothetical protein
VGRHSANVAGAANAAAANTVRRFNIKVLAPLIAPVL